MRILIVGNGGREHALLWKLHRDQPSAEFYATRPNGGMSALAQPVDLAPTMCEELAEWAEAHDIDLTVVGPETPLAEGIVDRFGERGLRAFGPTAAAARIEASKAYAKGLMAEGGIPTARHRTFDRAAPAEKYLRETGAPVVVKASGLAAGKGAVICRTVERALATAREMLEEGRFGEAGREVVVEEFMRGEELSIFALCDGEDAVPLLPSQDHKRIGEGDRGPNTGGMGAYAPVSFATPALIQEVRRTIFLPTLAALAKEGAPFRGLLYAGLMITKEGAKVVEFNCRFGDPETQVVLPLMESSLLEVLYAVASGESVRGTEIRWKSAAALVTVLASEGYPGSYRKGRPIEIPPRVEGDPGLVLFHAGTTAHDGRPRSSGGRVLGVTGLGDTLSEAAALSRSGAEAIAFEGKRYRRDIGWREFARDEGARP